MDFKRIQIVFEKIGCVLAEIRNILLDEMKIHQKWVTILDENWEIFQELNNGRLLFEKIMCVLAEIWSILRENLQIVYK